MLQFTELTKKLSNEEGLAGLGAGMDTHESFWKGRIE